MARVVKFLGCDPIQSGDTLAQRLVNHRKAIGTTQEDFARQIGVDPSTLARWECGVRLPTGEFASRVAAALDRIRWIVLLEAAEISLTLGGKREATALFARKIEESPRAFRG